MVAEIKEQHLAAEAYEPPQMVNRRAFFLGGGLGAVALVTPLIARSAPAADTLDSQTNRNLRWAGKNPADWVKPRDGVDHNVVIVGGGQTGLGIAYGLRRKGVGRVDIIDRSNPGQAGIWRNVARMHQLRTPKTQPGPEQGNPELGFRAWFETLQGPAAFDALDRIQRVDWADYLAWFEKVTEANVRYRTRLLDIEPVGDVLRLHLEVDGIPRVETTRKLVFANGYGGAGGHSAPGVLRNLPAKLWSHTDAPFDFDTLRGKVVGVIGAGASAFDAAATALEHGAADVHLYSRRPYIDYPPPGTAAGFASPPGLDRGHANVVELAYELPDEVRWRNHRTRENRAATVPLDSIERAVSRKNFHLHLNSELTEVAATGNHKVTARIGGKLHRFDHVIAGTGYRVDLSAQPEFARIQQGIALWSDRFHPGAGEEDAAVGRYPYLGAGFEFLARKEADTLFLRNIHCFNLAASVSYGELVGDIPSVVLQPRLISAIARDLFAEGIDVAANARFNSAPLPVPDPAPYQKAVSAA
jgi:cation diffusion facilitator CzcD-associated flavoprotein CzcO